MYFKHEKKDYDERKLYLLSPIHYVKYIWSTKLIWLVVDFMKMAGQSKRVQKNVCSIGNTLKLLRNRLLFWLRIARSEHLDVCDSIVDGRWSGRLCFCWIVSRRITRFPSFNNNNNKNKSWINLHSFIWPYLNDWWSARICYFCI